MRLVDAQHQIKRTLNAPAALERIQAMTREAGELHRSAVAARVCEEFGFFDARSQAQVATCGAALRALERAGRIELPPLRTQGGSCLRRAPAGAVAPPSEVPNEVWSRPPR